MNTQINTLCIGEKKMKWFSFGNKSGEKLVVLPGLSLKSVMPSADVIVNSYSAAAEEIMNYISLTESKSSLHPTASLKWLKIHIRH